MLKPELVNDPSEVTPEWLTTVLRYAGRLPADERVVDFRASPVPSTGLMSRIVRFQLVYNLSRRDHPQSVIAKFPSTDERSLEVARTGNHYVVEVNFFKEIKPAVLIRTPDVYFVEIDSKDNTRFIILTKDMVPEFSPGDQLQGCTVDEACVALTEVARLHGPLWGDPQIHNLRWIKRRLDPDSLKQQQSLYQSLLPAFKRRFSYRLSRSVLEILDAFADKYVRVFSVDAPQTIIHGDVRLDNFLIKKDKDDVEIAIVDYQTIRIGHGAYDVAYFICGTFPSPVRKEYESFLLEAYYRELRRLGVTNYDFEQLYRDYRRYSLAGVVTMVHAGCSIMQTERADEMIANVVCNFVGNAVDLGITDFF